MNAIARYVGISQLSDEWRRPFGRGPSRPKDPNAAAPGARRRHLWDGAEMNAVIGLMRNYPR